jgi:uncharacterized membrane protein YbhN (UPF0104 family)
MAETILALKYIYTNNKNKLLVLLKILMSAGLMIFILNSVVLRNIIFVFADADKALIFSAFGLSFFNIILQYLKWKIVCNSLLSENDNGKIIHSLFYGFSAGSFTPARVGEYLGRAIPFSDKPLMQLTAAAMIDKLFSLLIVLIFGSASFLLYFNIDIVSTIILVSAAALVIYLIFQRIKSYLPVARLKWTQKIYLSFSSLKNIDYKFRLKLTVLAVLFYCCFILQFALLVSAFSHHYEIINYIWTGNLVMFTKTIIPPVSLGELGIREGASVYFIKRFGETAATGFNASIFLFLINVLLPAVIGLILLLRRK